MKEIRTWVYGIIFIFGLLSASTVATVNAEEPAPESSELSEPSQSEHADSADTGDADDAEEGEEADEPDEQLSQDEIGYQGNWVKKREWLKQAQSQNEKIQADVVQIQKAQAQYTELFKEIDQKTNTFYAEKGFIKGNLEALFKDIEEDIAYEKQKRIDRLKKKSEEENTPVNYYDMQVELVEEEIKKSKSKVTQLKLDIESIEELDNSLQERLKMVDTQIADARELGKKAKKMTKRMWQIIDDTKARALFYDLKDDVGGQVSSIKTYVEQTLLDDMKQVVSKIEEQIDLVGSEVAQIEKKGLKIERRQERMRERRHAQSRDNFRREIIDGPDARDSDESEEEESVVRKKKKRRRSKKRKKQGSWFSLIVMPLKVVGSFFGNFYHAFFG